MPCPTCGAERLSTPVPPSIREPLPNVPDTILCCSHCLRLDPTDNQDTDVVPDFSAVSNALPSDPADAVAVLLLVDRLASLALNRQSIESLVEHLESAGVDPLLALDRLADDPSLDPAVDLRRRRAQLAQLLE